VNAQVKITREAVRAALEDAADLVRVGGMRRDETVAILREFFGEDAVLEPKARRAHLRGKLVEFRDAAERAQTKGLPHELASAVAAENAARAELARLEAARTAAIEKLTQLQMRRVGLESLSHRATDEDNLLLEKTSDPAIDEFIAKIEQEWNEARVRPDPLTFSPNRFVAPPLKKPPSIEAIPQATSNPRLLTVVPTERYGQLTAYMDGLREAAGNAAGLKLTALEGAALLAALERIEAAIPYRDGPDIVVRLRAKAARAERGQPS
jgi:hypothetical protein